MPTESPRVILASASPRRRALLDLLGLAHRVQPADIEEVRRPGEDPADFAGRAALDKALFVARNEDLPVLAADTVVAVDGDALGKPRDRQDAGEMLRRLSGRDHLVHTGVALAHGDRCHSVVDTAKVRMVSLDDAVVDWYLGTGEPMDKAGAYAVQGVGGVLVSSVIGSPHTVVGLPIYRLPGLFFAVKLDFWNMLK